jgi:hypothetical protein
MNQRKETDMPHYCAFDTLAYANKLKQAGADPKLAEAQAEATAAIMNDLIMDKLATKDDVKTVRDELRVTKEELRSEIKDLGIRMYKAMFTMISASVAILGGLQTLFHFIP